MTTRELLAPARWCTTAGRAQPLGASHVPGGVNFALHASGASAVRLVLMAAADGAPVAELPFPESGRFGTLFTVTVHGLDPGRFHYGYRVEYTSGGLSPVLLDPYATELAGAGEWGERPRYRCAVPAGDFDWGEDRPPGIPQDELIVYETHVRGYTRHASSAVTSPGTYAGLREKIPYLRGLGVNCVELLPLFEFDETDNTYVSPTTGEPLRNFWGYNSVGFFAPKAGYAADTGPGGPARELKGLVKALHAAGIAVILDVVYNHTAEGDHRGPTLSLRGLDESAYYLLDDQGRPVNLTATGNTVNCNHPVTRALILDSLRHWATEYRVDGFRFDMAAVLTRGSDGLTLSDPPLVEAIARDPALAHCVLVAEATDAAGAYQVGSFPAYGRWSEWNMRYRDAIRRFLLGRPGSAGEFATRLVGSPDLYPGRGATPSVNYITCHDGLTLADWTSYDRRHNEANGEDGRDGIPDEESWNCGHEGPTDDPAVLLLRARQARNALLLLLASQGVPMLLAGDEFGRTQHGNNNAYGQDSPLGWVDWDRRASHAGLLDFTRRAIALRKAHPALRRTAHPDGDGRPAAPCPPVSWHGEEPWQPDWSSGSTLLAAMLCEERDDGPADCVYLAVNSGGSGRTVRLPEPPPDLRWHVFADTGSPAHQNGHEVGEEPVCSRTHWQLAAHASLLLVAGPAGRGAGP
ncbi:glycogen debranching protein [Streptomyces hygroscopicus]|uniref:glycogen debranching protein n=1 Tax=Streptomyces hygroscopicus TaxID=1912 RepID=UPI00082EAACC|nr:isoamylase [Streptomyces hygroscopicus]GLV79345.1 glycogen operon protein GlgX homolog [Streptomyces hygroscopicus subsp. hygroscopicus]